MTLEKGLWQIAPAMAGMVSTLGPASMLAQSARYNMLLGIAG